MQRARRHSRRETGRRCVSAPPAFEVAHYNGPDGIPAVRQNLRLRQLQLGVKVIF